MNSFNMNIKSKRAIFIHFWHGIGLMSSSSDLFKEYLSKLLLETGSRGIRPVSFFYTFPVQFSIPIHENKHSKKDFKESDFKIGYVVSVSCKLKLRCLNKHIG